MPDENYQEIDARGFELELGYDSKAANPNSDFSYSISGNFGYAVNEVIQLDEAENLRPYQSRIGRPTGGIMGYVATGILRTQDDLDALPQGYTIIGAAPRLGMLNYKDIRGPASDDPDGRITSDDMEFIADYSTPPMNYGLSTAFNWRSLSLDILFQGTAGAKAMMHTNGRDIQARAEESSFGYFADSWTPENIDAKYPGYRATAYRTRFPESTFWLSDLTFLRLKNLTLSYNLPGSVVKVVGMNSVRLFFTGSNLMMIYSGNKIYDPEINNIRAYPLMETYSFGINVTL
jgi:hypothetical protein